MLHNPQQSASSHALTGVRSAISPVLPLVSVAVVNWNYRRFLRQCIESIKAQDYPHIEVAILDNGSSDDSRAVIEQCTAGDARFHTIFLDENIGQMNGGLHCLEGLSGEFVCFVDADDYLFEDFVSTHVQVHLALPRGVGLTSSNPIEVSAQNTVICGARKEFSRATIRESEGLRPLTSNPPRVHSISDETYRALSRQVSRVPPSQAGWIWAPGTATCYRRAIIDLVKPRLDLDSRLTGIDSQFSPMCHWITGSVLIDRAHSAYRLHGQNNFSSVPSVAGLVGGNAGPTAVHKVRDHQKALKAHTIVEKHRELAVIVGKARYWEILAYAVGRGNDRRARLQDEAFRQAVARALPALIQIHGVKAAVSGLRGIVPHRVLRDIIARADGAQLAPNTGWRLGALSVLTALSRARRILKHRLRELPDAIRRGTD